MIIKCLYLSNTNLGMYAQLVQIRSFLKTRRRQQKNCGRVEIVFGKGAQIADFFFQLCGTLYRHKMLQAEWCLKQKRSKKIHINLIILKFEVLKVIINLVLPVKMWHIFNLYRMFLHLLFYLRLGFTDLFRNIQQRNFAIYASSYRC